MRSGSIVVEALSYIRGRSIANQFMIIDEAQNLTPLEAKTIITRVGHGTKIIFTGDPYQIDNPYVDSSSNGFNYIVSRFRTEAIAAHIELQKGERSELAELAAPPAWPDQAGRPSRTRALAEPASTGRQRLARMVVLSAQRCRSRATALRPPIFAVLTPSSARPVA